MTPIDHTVSLVVIGALHVDEIVRLKQALIPGESNPVCTTRRAGGVAANVSRSAVITRPDLEVQLLACCGKGAEAAQLRSAMKDSGIELLSPADPANASTGRYSAVLTIDGDVYIGLADTAQAELLSIDTIMPRIDLDKTSAVIFDGNLSAHTMKELASRLPEHCLRFGISVSPAKAPRYNSCLCALDLLFCNRAEAEAMVQHVGYATTPATSCESLLSQLCNTGCSHVVLTDGARGVYIGSSNQQSCVPVTALYKPTTLNGPGDALAGATIAALVDCPLSHSVLVNAITHIGIPAATAVLTGLNQAPLLE